MAQAMYAGSGIGLAAPQVGISLAMIVADAGSGLYKLVNPRVMKKSGSQSFDEGCLSIPGVCVRVKRPRRVVVQALDEHGARVRLEAEGLLATVLQHEIDHLRGKLIIDYASLWKKIKIKKRLQGLKQRFKDEGLPEQGGQSCQLQL
jgi:peptide deformylase